MSTRRNFLKTLSGMALLTVVPRHVLGGPKHVAPSDQLTKGIMAVEAAKAGKDIWCEKPMTRTIGEGKRVVEAVKRNNRIFRLNTWFRFTDTFYGLGTTVEPLKKLIDSGLLGWPLKVTISGTTGFTWKFFWVGKENLVPQRVPSNLDYDMWLGPAPYKPYNEHRVHQTFRGYWDYDGGGLTDMGQHYMDPVQYLLGKDETSPVKVEVDAPEQHPDAVGIWRKIVYTYDDGCQIVLEGEGFESGGDTPYIEGPLGKVYKGFRCTIPDIMEKLAEMPDPAPQNTDFLECVLRPAFEPHVAFRPRQTTLHRRRCRQPTDRPADARPVAYLSTSYHEKDNHTTFYAGSIGRPAARRSRRPAIGCPPAHDGNHRRRRTRTAPRSRCQGFQPGDGRTGRHRKQGCRDDRCHARPCRQGQERHVRIRP